MPSSSEELAIRLESHRTHYAPVHALIAENVEGTPEALAAIENFAEAKRARMALLREKENNFHLIRGVVALLPNPELPTSRSQARQMQVHAVWRAGPGLGFPEERFVVGQVVNGKTTSLMLTNPGRACTDSDAVEKVHLSTEAYDEVMQRVREKSSTHFTEEDLGQLDHRGDGRLRLGIHVADCVQLLRTRGKISNWRTRSEDAAANILRFSHEYGDTRIKRVSSEDMEAFKVVEHLATMAVDLGMIDAVSKRYPDIQPLPEPTS